MNRRKMFLIFYLILLPLLTFLVYNLPKTTLLNTEFTNNPFKEDMDKFNDDKEKKDKVQVVSKLGRYKYYDIKLYFEKKDIDLATIKPVVTNPKAKNIQNFKGKIAEYTDFDEKKTISTEIHISLNISEEKYQENFTIRYQRIYPHKKGLMVINRPQLALKLEYEELVENKTRTIYHQHIIFIDYRTLIPTVF